MLASAMSIGSSSIVSAATPNDVLGTKDEAAVDKLIKNQVISGYTDGTYRPFEYITRAEVCTILVKHLEQVKRI